MVKGKKPFIDRKNAVKFQLVHRSQRDPLIYDETAPQRVLVETNNRSSVPITAEDKNQRKEKQKLYGIYFDDDYDYLQHLKEVDKEGFLLFEENADSYLEKPPETSKCNLNFPSSVFASKYEDKNNVSKSGNSTGLRIDWDPDVIAALDDCFDEDNLEDDFVLKASLDNTLSEPNETYFESGMAHEEVRSRFTDYSISSSVMHRNDQLTLLDDRFEQLYITYDDQELGDKSLDDIEGPWHEKHPVLIDCYKQLKKKQESVNYNKEWDIERIKMYSELVEEEKEIVNVPDKEKLNCESILSISTYNNNHPVLIDDSSKVGSTAKNNSTSNQKIHIDIKTGLPSDISWIGKQGGLNSKALSKLNVDNSPKNQSLASLLSVRPIHETAEEKRERKKLLKNYRSCRRVEKKNNFNAFKEEEKRLMQSKSNQQKGKKIL